jgi:hypothetical protein
VKKSSHTSRIREYCAWGCAYAAACVGCAPFFSVARCGVDVAGRSSGNSASRSFSFRIAASSALRASTMQSPDRASRIAPAARFMRSGANRSRGHIRRPYGTSRLEAMLRWPFGGRAPPSVPDSPPGWLSVRFFASSSVARHASMAGVRVFGGDPVAEDEP